MALDATTEFIVDLFLLMGSAVLAGEVAAHLGQPALVGQLLVGVFLGPTLFGSTSLGMAYGFGGLSPQLTSIQILATIFILFMAGLEVVPENIYKLGPGTIGMGVAVFALPFLVSTLVVPLALPSLHLSLIGSMFIALTLSITALPVMGIMLGEFGLIHTKLGDLLMSVALINELTAVTVFAILQRVNSGTTSGPISFLEALIAVAVFVAAMLSVHMVLRVLREARLWEPLKRGFQRTWKSKQGNFALLMVMVVGSTLFSQFMGLTYVVGAFYAGMLVTQESAGVEAHRSISSVFSTMSWGFFVPLFFAFVGVEMNLRNLLAAPVLAAFLALLTVALASKLVVGASISSSLGWGRADSLAIGYMVGSRGAVELAMATILLSLGLVNTTTFTIIASVGLIATIIAPVGALRTWMSDPTTRAQLYARVPSLRHPDPKERRLNPPLSWEEMRALYSREWSWPDAPNLGDLEAPTRGPGTRSATLEPSAPASPPPSPPLPSSAPASRPPPTEEGLSAPSPGGPRPELPTRRPPPPSA